VDVAVGEAALAAVATVLLAILSGAGGSALLELYYKPRRDQRRAAKLLLTEVLMNTDYGLLQAHARWKAPKKLPGDFVFSTLAWDAAAEQVSEVPTELLKPLIILYNRYQHCNHAVAMYGDSVKQLKALPPGVSPRRTELEAFLDSTVDVFNTGLDHAIDDGRKVLPELLRLAGIRERGKGKTATRDYQKVVDAHYAERAARLKSLLGLEQPHGKQ
jgi:hypothetical protein